MFNFSTYINEVKCHTNHLCFKRLKHLWMQPKGYDTNIKIYNCIAKDKVSFIVRNKDYVTWYTCGPTVYDSAHIGHASCYVKLDIIQRILRKYFKLNLITVMNVTDIDDKIINRSKVLSLPITELTKKYENEFWNDMNSLKITKPDVIVKVTTNMPIIIRFIQKLIDEGKAYITSDGSVYFEVNKLNYGKLQNITMEDEPPSRNKKSSMDFALWKSAKPDEISWKTDWGTGRPGWHVECSALASAVFQEQIDVHAGGIDLRFPHHENEEAQSCSYHGIDQWVNYWIHTGHLQLKHDVKMSKSLKNTISIQELLEKTNVDVFRMACAMSHYRHNMEYTDEFIQTAESYLNRIKSFVSDCDSYVKCLLPVANINEIELNQSVLKAAQDIDLALKDDFNTAKVIKIVLELVGVTNKMLHTSIIDTEMTSNLSNCAPVISVCNFVRENINMLGISLDESLSMDNEFVNASSVLDMLVIFRQNVRNLALQNKDKILLKYCDAVRDELKVFNVQIKDHGKLSSWSK